MMKLLLKSLQGCMVMKVTLDRLKLIGFRVLNVTSIKKPNSSKGLILQGTKIGKIGKISKKESPQ